MRFRYISHCQMPPLTAHADAVEKAVLILVRFFIYTHTLCTCAAKDLDSLHIYTGSPEPSSLDTVMSASTEVKCAWQRSFDLLFV